MTDQEETLPLFGETVIVGKRKVTTGKVRVRVSSETRDEAIALSLSDHDVAVERVAVGRFVDSAPAVRVIDGVTIIPVLEERAVVTVRLFLREEVHIRPVTTTHEAQRVVGLRRETATTERCNVQGEPDNE